MAFRQERFYYPESSLARYKEALQKVNWGHLTPLLKPDEETALLESLKERALNPQGPTPKLEDFLQRYQIKIEIISPQRLIGIYGGEKIITSLGKSLANLLSNCPVFLLIIDGAAREILGIKPPSKTRPSTNIQSWEPKGVLHGLQGSPYYSHISPPPSIDLDLCVVKKEGGPPLTLESLVPYLQIGPFKGKYGRIKVKQSRRRPGFKRVDIETRGYLEPRKKTGAPTKLKKRGFVFANLAWPENDTYSSSNRLIHQIMSRSVLDATPILLVPVRRGSRVLYFRGIAIDFLGYKKYLEKIKIFQKSQPNPRERETMPIERWLSLAYYPFPEFAFPLQNYPEMFAHFLKEFQNWAWNDAFPLMEINPPGKIIYRANDALEDPRAARVLSRRTCEWFYQNIINPFATSPEFLGRSDQQKDNAKELLETLKIALNGDPFLTIIRCLPPEKKVKGIPASGMGIFAREGFFPQLGTFLEEKNEFGQPRWQELLKIMETCPPAKNGWSTFLNFLFEQTNNNAQKVAELLTPSIWPGTPQEFLKKFLEKLEPKFAEEKKETIAQKIISLLSNSSTPLTLKQLVELSGFPPKNISGVLVSLRKRGLIINVSEYPDLRNLSQERKKRRISGQAYWTIYDRQTEFDETLYLNPLSRVYLILKNNHAPLTIPQIARLIEKKQGVEIPQTTIRASVRNLERLGFVVVSQDRPRKIKFNPKNEKMSYS